MVPEIIVINKGIEESAATFLCIFLLLNFNFCIYFLRYLCNSFSFRHGSHLPRFLCVPMQPSSNDLFLASCSEKKLPFIWAFDERLKFTNIEKKKVRMLIFLKTKIMIWLISIFYGEILSNIFWVPLLVNEITS